MERSVISAVSVLFLAIQVFSQNQFNDWKPVSNIGNIGQLNPSDFPYGRVNGNEFKYPGKLNFIAPSKQSSEVFYYKNRGFNYKLKIPQKSYKRVPKEIEKQLYYSGKKVPNYFKQYPVKVPVYFKVPKHAPYYIRKVPVNNGGFKKYFGNHPKQFWKVNVQETSLNLVNKDLQAQKYINEIKQNEHFLSSLNGENKFTDHNNFQEIKPEQDDKKLQHASHLQPQQINESPQLDAEMVDTININRPVSFDVSTIRPVTEPSQGDNTINFHQSSKPNQSFNIADEFTNVTYQSNYNPVPINHDVHFNEPYHLEPNRRNISIKKNLSFWPHVNYSLKLNPDTNRGVSHTMSSYRT